MQQEQVTDPYANFLKGITNDSTAVVYRNSLKVYMRFLGIQDYSKLMEGTDISIEDTIGNFITHERNRHISSSLIRTRLAAIKLFYDMNRKPLSWRLITRTVGRTKKIKDRAYTRDEIRRLIELAYPRDRAAILLMCSSGMRVGALPDLNICNLHPVAKYGIYKISVYEGHDEDYKTYCTPEARQAIDSYIEYRKRLGERITDSSPLFRKEFDQRREDSPIARAELSTLTISINRLIEKAGIRPKVRLVEGQKSAQIRHEVKALHGFRKFFDTVCTDAGLSLLYLEMLEGHDTKLKDSYYRPSDEQLLEGSEKMLGYVSAINNLTINEENRLKRRVEDKDKELTKLHTNVDEMLEWFNKTKKTE